MVKCKNDSDCRSFTIAGSGIGYKGSRFISDGPSAAAKKAGKRLFQLVDNEAKFKTFNNKKTLKFIVRETTRGAGRKTYYYIVSREEKKEPLVRVINGVEVTYKWDYNVKKCSAEDPEMASIVKKNSD